MPGLRVTGFSTSQKIFGLQMANFARASSLAEQKLAGGLKCHDSTSWKCN